MKFNGDVASLWEGLVATRTHTSPDGQIRVEVRCELSHVNLGFVNRHYAGVTIYREVLRAVPFNPFDPGTWGGSKFVRSGNATPIFVSARFDDGTGADISSALNLFTKNDPRNDPGHFGAFAIYIYWLGSGPAAPGIDARSVRTARLTYLLPWETSNRSLSEP